MSTSKASRFARRPASGVRGAMPLLIAFIALLALWQLLVITIRPDAAVLPPPLLVAHSFGELLASGELIRDAGISLARVFVAWTLSGCVAIPLGLAMGWSDAVNRVVDPFVELLRPISPLAWIPLAILWFGINEAGKIFIVCIATFFPILLSTVAGVRRVDPVQINAGQALGCISTPTILRKVVFPAALPAIFVGLRIAFGMGWAAIIAGELVAARSGLGYLIANGMEILRADKVFIGMVVIGFLGVTFDAVFQAIGRKVSWGAT